MTVCKHCGHDLQYQTVEINGKDVEVLMHEGAHVPAIYCGVYRDGEFCDCEEPEEGE